MTSGKRQIAIFYLISSAVASISFPVTNTWHTSTT